STQTPHLVKIKLAYLFRRHARDFHVFSEHVGGGFGGKQELLTEDLCVLAALKTGRPVKWEFTRTEQFVAATTRHPMKIAIKLGARSDGTLTAMQIHTVSNTGAYGNHAGEVLASSLGSSMATYRCANKKGTGYAVYTNTVPSGAFRGYGATQPAFAVESAIDELARELGIDPFTMRRTNMIRATDPVQSIWPTAGDAVIGSYALDQCLDFVEQALASGRGEPKPDGDEWLEGRGVAIHAQDCAPPTEHRSESHLSLLPDGTYHLGVGSAEFGNGIRNAQRQVAPAALHARPAAPAQGLPRSGTAPLRRGDMRQHGPQRGQARRPEGRRSPAGELARAGGPAFRRPGRRVPPRGWAGALRRSRALVAATLRGGTAARQTPPGVQGVRVPPLRGVPGPWVSHRRPSGHGRDPDPAERASVRRRHDPQPDAGAGTNRGRHRPGDRDDALRADGDRRGRGRGESHLPEL